MGKLKICVYAIAKNEEANVERFVRSAAPADYIAVLDTGSTDKTVELLESRGVIVHQEKIVPWRFDAARNRSLELVPMGVDICVCVDLDEELSPGWREELEKAWEPGTVMARFTCVRGGTTFLQSKAHAAYKFEWKYPVHEVLFRADGGTTYPWETVDVPAMQTIHHPDDAKSRGQYLPLLEQAVKEWPDDPRCAHYLGREYFYHHRWDDAIRELERHLTLNNPVWREERSASMRYLAECYLWGKQDLQTALAWATRAVAETPECREAWYEAEKVAYHLGDWPSVVHYGCMAMIRRKSNTYINSSEAWGGAVEDILSIAYWKLGYGGNAEDLAIRALELDPDNERVRENLAFFARENRKAGDQA